jgi:hypothetical protein
MVEVPTDSWRNWATFLGMARHSDLKTWTETVFFPAIAKFLTARLEMRSSTNRPMTSPRDTHVISYYQDEHTACTESRPDLSLLTEIQLWGRAMHIAGELFSQGSVGQPRLPDGSGQDDRLTIIHTWLKFACLQLTTGRAFDSTDSASKVQPICDEFKKSKSIPDLVSVTHNRLTSLGTGWDGKVKPDDEQAEKSTDVEPKTPEGEQRRLRITWINPTVLEDAVHETQLANAATYAQLITTING